MKTKLTFLTVLLVTLAGCMAPNYTRLIPENKHAHIKVYSPIYGFIEIDTRVPGDEKQTLEPLEPLKPLVDPVKTEGDGWQPVLR